MATSANAQIGKDVAMTYRSVASPPTYATVGYVRSLGEFGDEKPRVESTTLDSQQVEYVDGLRDSTEFEATLTLTAAVLAIIEAWRDTTDAQVIKLTWPAPASLTRYLTLTNITVRFLQTTPGGLCEVRFKGLITAGPASTEPA